MKGLKWFNVIMCQTKVQCMKIGKRHGLENIYNHTHTHNNTGTTAVLGGSGRVVNSLDFCLASLKSLGCFYFWCILSSQSQWKVVTVNLQILHCQL